MKSHRCACPGVSCLGADLMAGEYCRDEERFDEWIRVLDEDVIQGEFGYERGEFTVYPVLWRPLYERELTPAQAWRRALDAHANGRIEDECLQSIDRARIEFEDARHST